MKRWTPIAGTPQGAVISPLLANLYLHSLDKLMMQAGYMMVRYADDFVILCQSREDAQNALVLAQQWVDDKGLILHPDKTHVGNCLVAGQGFEFLGYRFEAGKRWVRKKSLKALKDKIRNKTRRSRGDSMKTIIKDLNPMLKGWFNYFKHAHKWTFSGIDGFIRRRLRSLRNKQRTGQAGFGRSKHLLISKMLQQNRKARHTRREAGIQSHGRQASSHPWRLDTPNPSRDDETTQALRFS